MVECRILFTGIIRLIGKRSDLLAEAAVSHMVSFKDEIKKIIFANDLEFTSHETIVQGLEADIYFTHPYSSWERGINEDTNCLIRKY
ncbi:hypothetical protein FIU95_05010 [Microbulbifer sp. THAF38]|nr:hypothetical protein FIU95_05010 [Microbulbifer sp. THAF38]